jgi:putative flippase GtrA
MISQFSLFLLSGGCASLMNWGSRFLFSEYFNFQVSVVLAFFVGLLSGFILMRLFVFREPDGSMQSQVTKYLIVNMLALAQTFIVSIIFLKIINGSFESRDTAEATAHAIGVVIPVFTSYLGHKYFTFR